MTILKNAIILILTVSFAAASCKKSETKDLSMTVKEYQALGMPDPGKVWKNSEYENANIMMGTLKIDNPLRLPRKNSKKSGQVFQRLISEENLEFVNDTTAPLSLRAFKIQTYPFFVSALTSLYTVNANDKPYYPGELMDIRIFSLHLNEAMFRLSEKIMKSTDEGDISLQSGQQSVKHNYLNLITLLLGEQGKSDIYDTRDLERLSQEISRSLNENNYWILTADRDTLTAQIQNIITKSSTEYIKENYIRALKIVKGDN